MQNQPEADLVRGIRRWDLVAICINGIIGAGIFGLPSKVYSLIGTYSLIAFVVCAVVVALIILCFAEVSSRFEETGGPYLYAREAYQPAVAFEIGWLIWLGSRHRLRRKLQSADQLPELLLVASDDARLACFRHRAGRYGAGTHQPTRNQTSRNRQ